VAVSLGTVAFLMLFRLAAWPLLELLVLLAAVGGIVTIIRAVCRG
jgi:hypothetical protein